MWQMLSYCWESERAYHEETNHTNTAHHFCAPGVFLGSKFSSLEFPYPPFLNISCLHIFTSYRHSGNTNSYISFCLGKIFIKTRNHALVFGHAHKHPKTGRLLCLWMCGFCFTPLFPSTYHCVHSTWLTNMVCIHKNKALNMEFL